MKQYLYKNRNNGNYQLFPVNDIHRTAHEFVLIGECDEIVAQNENLKATNNKLESFIKSQPIIV